MPKQTTARIANHWAVTADLFRKERDALLIERDALLAECAAMRLHIDKLLIALDQQMAQREELDGMFAERLLERLRGLSD